MFNRDDRLKRILEAEDGPVKDFLFDFLDCEFVISYRFFLDDSGTHEGPDYAFLAGTMMSVDEWGAIDLPWRDILSRYELSFFHAADIWAGHGEKFLARDDVLQLFRLLGELIIAHHCLIWWGCVQKNDYQRLSQQFPQIDVTDFELLVFGSIGSSRRMMQSLGETGKIGVILEKGGPEIRSCAKRRIEDHEKRTGYFDPPWQESPKGPVPLQVADYVAWHYNRYAVDQFQKNKLTPLPFYETMKHVDPRRFWGKLFDEVEIRLMLEQLATIP